MKLEILKIEDKPEYMSEFQIPHAAFLASPGMGHLIPILELAKRMVTANGFRVTVFAIASDLNSLVKSQNDHIDIIQLPSVDVSALTDPNTPHVEKQLLVVREWLPTLRSSIAAMKSPPTALVVDMFGTDAFEIALEFGLLRYVFVTSGAWFLAVMLYTSTVDQNVILEDHLKNRKPLQIPGCKSLRFEDTLDSLGDAVRSDKFRITRVKMTESNGILINTWEDLEHSSIQALGDDNFLRSLVKAPIYPVGPLVRKDENNNNMMLENEVKNWLDRQPSESVLYVSFGSGGTLSAQQTIELGWGLEQSKQRFIWVVRCPNYIPEGWLNRTKGIGLVIPKWAAQAQILSHPSVGGFLSHCGWNSTLESICNGVPMIAWPLYAEQRLNAALLAEEFGIAVRSPSKEIVGRDEIEKMVREIMVVDDAMRKRVKELSQNAEKAIREGGSSFNSLSQVLKYCLHHK